MNWQYWCAWKGGIFAAFSGCPSMLHRALPKGPCWEALVDWAGQGEQPTRSPGHTGQSWGRLVTQAPTTTQHHTTMVAQWQKL